MQVIDLLCDIGVHGEDPPPEVWEVKDGQPGREIRAGLFSYLTEGEN